MKKIIIWVISLLLFVILLKTTQAQQKNTFTLSTGFCHYSGIEDHKISTVFGYSRSWLNPNFDFLYHRKINDNSYLGVGLNYQNGRFGSARHFYGRFKLHELSFPIFYRKEISVFHTNNFAITAGIYNGILLYYLAEREGSAFWDEPLPEEIPNYSSDKFFTDLFVDLEYKLLETNYGNLALAPYVKARINETWLNHYYRNISGGIRIKFSLDL